jgi:putative sterol carrier protein
VQGVRGSGHEADGGRPDDEDYHANAQRASQDAREAYAGRSSADAHSGPSMPKVTSVAEYFATLEQRFVPSATRGLDAVFQWELAGDDGGTYHAIVKDGTMQLTEGRHPQPTVTIAMPSTDYVKVVNGELDGARAFTTGRGKVSGKIRMAMKMRSIFPVS